MGTFLPYKSKRAPAPLSDNKGQNSRKKKTQAVVGESNPSKPYAIQDKKKVPRTEAKGLKCGPQVHSVKLIKAKKSEGGHESNKGGRSIIW